MSTLDFDLDLDLTEKHNTCSFYEVLQRLKKGTGLCATNNAWDKEIYQKSCLILVDDAVIPVNFMISISDIISDEWVVSNYEKPDEYLENKFLNKELQGFIENE